MFFREIYCNPEMSEKSRNDLLFIMLFLVNYCDMLKKLILWFYCLVILLN